MSKVTISRYQTPGFGNIYYEDRIGVNPSQDHGGSGGGPGGPDNPFPSTNNVEANDTGVLPVDIASDQVIDVIQNVPEADPAVDE